MKLTGDLTSSHTVIEILFFRGAQSEAGHRRHIVVGVPVEVESDELSKAVVEVDDKLLRCVVQAVLLLTFSIRPADFDNIEVQSLILLGNLGQGHSNHMIIAHFVVRTDDQKKLYQGIFHYMIGGLCEEFGVVGKIGVNIELFPLELDQISPVFLLVDIEKALRAPVGIPPEGRGGKDQESGNPHFHNPTYRAAEINRQEDI